MHANTAALSHASHLDPSDPYENSSRPPLWIALFAAITALSACGGGGDVTTAVAPGTVASNNNGTGGSTTSTPSPSPAPAPAPVPTGSWVPKVTDTWQWQLSGSLNTSINARVYDVDLFDLPLSTLNALKASGRAVVCYFSAGTSENWRSDFTRFTSQDMGAQNGWPGERWLDTRSANVREIMKSRLDLAASRGCDGVEPDNVDGYSNNPGFPLTAATQIDYNRFLATEAHKRGLKVALKNTVDLLTQLEPDFDFAVNEQCNEFNECGGYSVFTNKGKPVFNAEYASKWVNDSTARATLCAANRARNIRTLVLPLNLDGAFRFSCD